MATTEFQLIRNNLGLLVLTQHDGKIHEDVFPVRAFPLTSPDKNIALVNLNGQEVAWIDDLLDLPETILNIVRDELEGLHFMPEIQTILSVTSTRTPCTWHVVTDKGETNFLLLEEEDLQPIGFQSFLLVDSHGIHFFIRDKLALNKYSRKIIERFC